MHVNIDQELLSSVSQTSESLGKIAQDELAFQLLVESFRAQDYETFNELIHSFGLQDRCPQICRWLCSKECVLVCLTLCGSPHNDAAQLNLAEFAALIAKVSANREMLARLAGAVIERDERSFNAIAEMLGVERYKHYLCHWICSLRCRLICELLCAPNKPFYLIGCTHLLDSLQQASSAILLLRGQANVLTLVEKGVLAGDCVMVRNTLERAGLQNVCHWICHWLCTWRCIRVCYHLCRTFVAVPVERELIEIHAFAKAISMLSTQTGIVEKLFNAIETENLELYAELLNKFGLTRFCHQLCHWFCRVQCWRFCQCVCPAPQPRPWFTHIGHFHIYGDIQAANGLTNKSVFGHGGPNFGFFGCIELRGFCSVNSPTVPGSSMRYRFLYERAASRTALVGNLLCPVIVGSRTIYWDINGAGLEETFQTIIISGSGATPNPTPTPILPPGTPWGAPPPHVITPDADGWIAVDHNALGAAFNGALIGFNTTVPFPDGDPAPGVAAGTAVPAANQKNGVDIAIIFEATRVGIPASPPDYSNTLMRAHINNWNEVSLLDLLQFHTGGGNPCSPLTNSLDIEYTTDHELMAAWDVSVYSAAFAPSGIPPLPAMTSWPAGPSVAHPRGDAGTFHLDISNWPMCSYTVSLTTRRALTNGLVDDDADVIQKTFCIGRKTKI